jgi:hypothetical protein
MTDKEYKEYISHKTAEGIKNTEARFDYLSRNVEISNQMIKEKEKFIASFLEKLSKEPVQLQLFTPEDEEVITVLESFRSYALRGPAGIIKACIY